MTTRPSLEVLENTLVKKSRSVSLYKSLSTGAFALCLSSPLVSIGSYILGTGLAAPAAIGLFIASATLQAISLFTNEKATIVKAQKGLLEARLSKRKAELSAIDFVTSKTQKTGSFSEKPDYSYFKRLLSPETLGTLIHLSDYEISKLPNQAQYQIYDAQATLCAKSIIQQTHQPEQHAPMFAPFHKSEPHGRKTTQDIKRIHALRDRLALHPLAAPFAQTLSAQHLELCQKYHQNVEKLEQDYKQPANRLTNLGFAVISASGYATASKLLKAGETILDSPTLSGGLIAAGSIMIGRLRQSLQKVPTPPPVVSSENLGSDIRDGASALIKIERHAEKCGYRPVIQFKKNLFGKIKRTAQQQS